MPVSYYGPSSYVTRVRTSNNHLISVTPLLHPLAQPLLTVVVLVTVGRVDEVTAGFDEGVEKRETLLLVHGTHEVFPCLTNAHGTESEWRDTDAGMLGENTETTERGLGLRCGLEEVGHRSVSCEDVDVVKGCLLVGEVVVARGGSCTIHRYWMNFFLGDEGLNSCRLTLGLTRQDASYICFGIKVSCFIDDVAALAPRSYPRGKAG